VGVGVNLDGDGNVDVDATFDAVIPAEHARTLGNVARQQGTTLEAAVVGLVAAVLGPKPTVIGVPALGRVAPVAIAPTGSPSYVTYVDLARRAIPAAWAAAAGFRAPPASPLDAVVTLRGELAGDLRVRAPRELAERIATLLAGIAHKPAIAIADVLGGATPVDPSLAPDPSSHAHPLTHAQERLWFLETLSPGTPTNHIQRVYRVDGPLDLALLARAMHALSARHPALRTVIRTIDGAAHQLVLRELPVDHRVDDVSDLPPDARPSAIAAAARADHDRPFALDTGPLYRTTLVRSSPTAHHLVLTIHHVITDALSIIVWLRELAEHYHALATHTVPRVPPLTTSISQIAAFERSAAGRARSDADLAFWLDRLAGARPLDLPLDFRRPRTPSVGRTEVHELLGAERAAELRALGRRRNATLNVTLFAAAAAFLSRLTGQDDLVCVVPAARRDEPGREAVIGLLLNLLPLRLHLGGDPSFAELITRTAQAMREAIAHAESPFENIVAALGLPREPGRQPLLDVIVNMVPGTELTRRGDLRFAMEQSSNSAQPCDLVIGATTRPGGLLDLMMRARDDVFAEVTAHRMMRRFVTLLLAAHANPTLPLSELPMLPDDERVLVTVTWNDTAMALPERPVHELVDAALARAPDAPAVVQQARAWSGGELHARADVVARALVARGVAPGARVGVAIPPSPELAAAALGVMRAGAVYVPLDPAQPAARVDQLARETSLVLDQLPAGAPAATLPRVHPDAPAYVVFTSGSTGTPKGVQTSHRALVNQLAWFARDIPWRAGEVGALRSSPAFVDSLWELFGPLAAGVPLAIATTDEMRDPRLLAQMAARHGVTRMMIVPSLLRALLELGTAPPQLDLWLATSEELQPALVRAFRAARPHDRLWNLYGASETADQVAAFEVREPDPLRTPIGRPIANSRLYVVDTAGLPVPIGVVGELCVAGVGVSDGYLGGAHAERFAYVHGERVYRTGDRGRWRHDGVLDYLGRFDHQLKIRGVRVDPAEVEAALLAHDLAAAVVTAQPGFDGEARLVAHVVQRPGGKLEASELRRRLRAQLPETMIPTSIVAVAELPLGATGKVDRDALPAVAVGVASSRAPASASEHAVALAWEQLLGHPVGAEDDFFAAGGQSLVAAQLGARLAERFGVELPLPVLFERPTVATQAAWLDDALRSGGDTAIPHVPPGEPVPLSFAQERLWFASELASAAPAPKLRSALRLDGTLDPARLEAALELVAQRQAALRTVFDPHGRWQRVAARVPRDHLDADLAATADDARDDVVRAHLDAERDKPFDLANGPPWRTRLLRFGPHTHVLVATMHHLVTDGISLGVWRDELHEAYSALGDGRAPDLPALAATTADVAAWQRRADADPGRAGVRSAAEGRRADLIDAGAWAVSRRYWQRQLAGARPIELPLARPRTAWSTGRGGRARLELDDTDGAALAALARAEQTTVFGVLLAGAAAWLRELSGQDDLVIGTIAAGRDRPEVRPLIGLFLNPLPLRVDASGEPSPRELVRRAGAVVRAALAHGEVPFERIVADAAPERRPFRQPLFDVVLNHHPLADPPRLGELTVRHVRGVTAPVAPYELMIRTIARRGITVQLDYQRDRFDDEVVDGWLQRYVAVLRRFAGAPDAR
jgi:amino acid adenylation domain-containing protein